MVQKTCLPTSVALLALISAGVVLASEPNVSNSQRPQSAYSRNEVVNVARHPNRARSEPSGKLGLPFVYDRQRAAKSMREISEHVKRIVQRSAASPADPEFDPDRADESLQTIKAHVSRMQVKTRNKQRTIAGPVEGMYVHHYNRVRVPTPERINGQSGLTHQELAEVRLLKKGYRKTSDGWVPPNVQHSISQQQPNTKPHAKVAEAPNPDPF